MSDDCLAPLCGFVCQCCIRGCFWAVGTAVENAPSPRRPNIVIDTSPRRPPQSQHTSSTVPKGPQRLLPPSVVPDASLPTEDPLSQDYVDDVLSRPVDEVDWMNSIAVDAAQLPKREYQEEFVEFQVGMVLEKSLRNMRTRAVLGGQRSHLSTRSQTPSFATVIAAAILTPILIIFLCAAAALLTVGGIKISENPQLGSPLIVIGCILLVIDLILFVVAVVLIAKWRESSGRRRRRRHRGGGGGGASRIEKQPRCESVASVYCDHILKHLGKHHVAGDGAQVEPVMVRLSLGTLLQVKILRVGNLGTFVGSTFACVVSIETRGVNSEECCESQRCVTKSVLSRSESFSFNASFSFGIVDPKNQFLRCEIKEASQGLSESEYSLGVVSLPLAYLRDCQMCWKLKFGWGSSLVVQTNAEFGHDATRADWCVEMTNQALGNSGSYVLRSNDRRGRANGSDVKVVEKGEREEFEEEEIEEKGREEEGDEEFEEYEEEEEVEEEGDEESEEEEYEEEEEEEGESDEYDEEEDI